MKKDNSVTGGRIPLGLGMAFAQNVAAMKRFSEMSDSEQAMFIENAHSIGSKQEMQEYVAKLNSKEKQ